VTLLQESNRLCNLSVVLSAEVQKLETMVIDATNDMSRQYDLMAEIINQSASSNVSTARIFAEFSLLVKTVLLVLLRDRRSVVWIGCEDNASTRIK
jgi:hypothetical protein